MSRKNKKDSLQTKLESIKLDLDAYQIQLHFHNNTEPLVIHFDKPARRFYFSLIALIVTEMKRLDTLDFIHIRKHENTLKILDNSLAGQYTSKSVTGMWDKVRKAWRYNLPDLEIGTHFKILDRDIISPYEKGGKNRYECSDDECDIWANLFTYDESNPWRFKFAIDSVSISLNDISITLGNRRDNSAWNEFLNNLSIQTKAVSIDKRAVPGWWKKLAFALVATLIVGAATFAIWSSYIRPVPPTTRLELPDKPSIAVLPFDNMSDDPDQEYFSDGITEHIITWLSKVPHVLVIARNSSFSYKNRNLKVQQIAEELGVRYILEGSVQRSDNRLRINVQLVDAIKGHHLWAENYDRKIKDVFSLQDEIAMKIMAEMQVELAVDELGRLSAIKTKNIKAYEKYLIGYEFHQRRTEADTLQARKLSQEAISLDPGYGAPYILLAKTYLDDVWYYKSKNAKESLDTAERLALKAIELSGQDATAHQILGSVSYLRRQYDRAIVECKKAIDLSPNSAEANFYYGHALRWAGRFDEAILSFKKAIRLNPIKPLRYMNNLAWVYAYSGQREEAIALWNEAIDRNPDYFFAYLGLALTYQLSGKEDKAQKAASEVLRLKPNLTISKLKKGPATKNIDRDRLFDAWRKAGIPD